MHKNLNRSYGKNGRSTKKSSVKFTLDLRFKILVILIIMLDIFD